MIVTLVLIVLVSVLLYFLFAPMVLLVNTNTHEYYIQLRGLAKAIIEEHSQEIVQIKLNVLFMKFYFYPLKKATKRTKTQTALSSVKKSRNISLDQGLRILRSFKIVQLRLDMDTGDCIWNARLYPLFELIKYNKVDFNINFEGRNELVVRIENRPWNIIKSFINL